MLPEHIWNTGMIFWPGQDGGFLGRAADPWLIHCDPSSPDFQVPGVGLPAEVPALRLQERDVAARAGQPPASTHVDRSEAIDRFDHRSRGRRSICCGPARRGAPSISTASRPRCRDRYGRNRCGQSVLLARRLVEAGVSLVQVNWTRMPGDTNDSPAWDTHNKNAQRLKNNLMPPMDLAYSALLEDLEERGLLDETLVIWMGEFGRTPKINGGGGRDHWGHVFSGGLAGGGVRGGAGASAPPTRSAGIRTRAVCSRKTSDGDHLPLSGVCCAHRGARYARPTDRHQPRRGHSAGRVIRPPQALIVHFIPDSQAIIFSD